MSYLERIMWKSWEFIEINAIIRQISAIHEWTAIAFKKQ